MNNNDMKALLIREDLLKICKKYNCTMDGLEDGDIEIDVYDKEDKYNDIYILSNLFDGNYGIYKAEPFTNLMEIYIKDSFNRYSDIMTGLNNIKVGYGIITNDAKKAENKLLQIKNSFKNEDIYSFTLSSDYKELKLKNNTAYLWVKPNSKSRAYRFANVIIDKNISIEELKYYIMPLCYACGKNNVEVF